MVKKLSEILDKKLLFKRDLNGRTIYLYRLSNCQFFGNNLFYPNVLVHSGNTIYNPSTEKVMSLEGIKLIAPNTPREQATKTIDTPVFYFIYNVDNYYHFVYDTLPYLISFFKIKKKIKNLKLLINVSGPDQTKLYKFVEEFLLLLKITKNDMLFVQGDMLYSTVYISDSYTHGYCSNLPPRKEIYKFFNKIKQLAGKDKIKRPNKIYISRRTWTHNDFSNIGTDYTQRRRLVNEDELVKELKNKNITEVFTEQLTTIEKIRLFSQAQEIFGSIGGGMVNVLFASNRTKIHIIVSPTFFEKNKRFKFSFFNKHVRYYTDVYHIEHTKFKKYMRVSIPSKKIVGEVVDIKKNKLIVSYYDYSVAGWNSAGRSKKITVNSIQCIKLDNGLNSMWGVKLPL